MSDPRTYADRMFFDFVDGRLVPKKAGILDCSTGVPELPKDQILILENYKKNKQRGRKDKLEGKTVAYIPTDKQPLFVPIDEVLKMSSHMNSYFTNLLTKYTLPQNEEVSEAEEQD